MWTSSRGAADSGWIFDRRTEVIHNFGLAVKPARMHRPVVQVFDPIGVFCCNRGFPEFGLELTAHQTFLRRALQTLS
ncbi:MAG: hypothetical protein KGL18_00435 [Burkholderiales bacterium]|nr:hypothetical protein [Burkholderiales bacterium]MDE1925978.1 hypothetical protein [Burkholderiales bacterium]MDE2160079.1 hypothetical protein [Burkholderiales bacterium]MDE2501429.1 hypothetical protein [Burkholderiales bacterium]